jgi:hypothetical protein
VVANTVVFVQGGKKNEDQYPWMFWHLHPRADPDPEPVNLAFFDYPAGQLKIWKDHVLTRGKPPTKAPDEVTELTPKVKIRSGDGTVDEAGPDRPSVLALYDWVKKQPKESIRSLQVFSHGQIGGPIIWNSFEYDKDGNRMRSLDDGPRDPHDTDFRVRDLRGSNPLAGAEGQKFAAAFRPGALIKLWGCLAPEGVRAIVGRYWRAGKGERGDAARWAHLEDYLDWIAASYAMEMAARLNLSVWAAPIGWGSDPHTRVPVARGHLYVKYQGRFPPDLDRDQWWRVSWFFRHQDRGVKFYEDVLKARVDALDFVEHKRSWFDDARRKVVVPGEPDPFDAPAELQQRLINQVESWGSSGGALPR